MEHRIAFIVANEPSPDREEEYNQWYNEKHVPMMFGFKGMKNAARYRLTNGSDGSSRYIAIYEFDSKEDLDAFMQSAELADAIKDFDGKWKHGGFERKWGATYELIKSWEKQ